MHRPALCGGTCLYSQQLGGGSRRIRKEFKVILWFLPAFIWSVTSWELKNWSFCLSSEKRQEEGAETRRQVHRKSSQFEGEEYSTHPLLQSTISPLPSLLLWWAVHACHPGALEAKAGGLTVWGRSPNWGCVGCVGGVCGDISATVKKLSFVLRLLF